MGDIFLGIGGNFSLSTVAGSAGVLDYVALNKQVLTFAAYETVKTVTVNVLKDEVKEGTENFNLVLLKNIGDASATVTSTAYIKDVLVPIFDYVVTSNASTEASAIAEGGKVTFTITRDGSGAESTVYVSTLTGSAGNADYIAIEKKAVTFSANQTIATIEVEINQDWWLESPEIFRLAVYKNSSDTAYLTSASAYIKDAATNAYQYTVSNSNNTADSAISEGGTLSFTITRSGSGTASTVYLSTEAGTAGNSDYASLNKTAVSFTEFETSKTVTIATFQDALTEGNEYFWLDLYQNYADQTYISFSRAYIKDATVANYDYTISSNAETSDKAVSEGSSVTYTITRSGSGSASTVYVQTVEGTASNSDFAALGAQAVVFAAYETSKTITINTYQDAATEGSEYFWLTLYKNYTDSNYSAYGTAYIKDTVAASYDYTVTTNASTIDTAVSEGGKIRFTVTRSSSGTASTVYLNSTAGTAGTADYSPFKQFAVTFAANETIKSYTFDTYLDGQEEGVEYLWIDLYKNLTDTDYASFAKAYIKDAANTSYDYTITSSAGSSATAATEGSSITYTITRSASGSASTVYVSAVDGTANAADYGQFSKQAVTFAAYETSKTITVNTYQDAQTEGVEYCWLTLYKNYSDTNYTTYAPGYIADAVVTNYDYTVTTNASSSANAVTEGGKITFTVTRSASGSVSTVYLNSTAGSANESDYSGFNKFAVSFAANETIKTYSFDTYIDSETEDTEFFWIDLYKNFSDTDYASYTTVYIKDATVTNYNYTITSTASTSASAVSEGDSVTYTITRSGSGTASTVYVNTVDGTTTSADYGALSKQAITFASNETSKTITVATYKDAATEGQEYFWLTLYKNYSDVNYSAYSQTFIKDFVGVNYDYTISTSANTSETAVTEGNKIIFTITRNASGTASTVYLSSTAGTAGADDYYVFTKYAVSFAENETSKTFSFDTYADSINEGSEYLWIDLYKNYSDEVSAAYGKAFIKDVNSSFDYTISSNAASADSAVSEGASITYTITRSGSGTTSTVYVSTANGTAEASDYATLNKQAVSFAANETSKTITISTYQDALSESAEYFWLTLYKNSTDINYASYGIGYIKDVVVANYDYTITTNASTSETAVTEGNKITFTVTRSGSGSASTVYVSTTSGTAGAADYYVFSKYAVSFAANETVKSFTFDSYADNLIEGTESFWLDLYKNESDTNYLTYTKVYIKDPSSGQVAPDGLLGIASASLSPPLSSVAAVNSFPNHTLGEFKNSTAFALLKSDGSVVTWGNQSNGGNSSSLAQALNGQDEITQIFSDDSAFAALRKDGSVITWGNADNGGDSSKLSASLNGDIDVSQIFSSKYAFAALLSNGAVVSWGNDNFGGDSSAVAVQLNGTIAVKQLFSNSSAFAAVRADGSVVTWGYDAYGGSSTSVAALLNGSIATSTIYSTSSAFAALRVDGSVVTWGSAKNGGDSAAIATQLNGGIKVSQISATNSAFAALRADGSVVTWGDDGFGGNSAAVTTKISAAFPVQQLYSTSSAFAALHKDGTVVTWGYAAAGGTVSASTSAALINVTQIVSNKSAFAALRTDGSVVTWGDDGSGGNSTTVKNQLDGKNPITKMFATDHAFAALRADGSLITWGDALAGGDSSAVSSQLDGSNKVIDVFSTGAAFVALHLDGTVVNWGDLQAGGDSSSLNAQVKNVVAAASIYTNDIYTGGTLLTGGASADSLLGTWGNDVINSLGGNDSVTGGAGHDKIDGGAGNDTAIYLGNRANFKITRSNDSITVNDSKGSEGIDHLTSIENLKFADMTINLQVGDKAKAISASALQSIVELYIAYFNRVPDADGMAYWIDQYKAGASIDQIGMSFYAAAVSPMFSALTGYSTSMSNADFIKIIYANVLGRSEVDQGGMDYWSNSLASGAATRGSLINTILGSAHSFKGRSDYGYVADLLDNKYLVGKYFAIEQGINYNTPEESYSKGVAIAALITATDTSAALALIGVGDVGFSLY